MVETVEIIYKKYYKIASRALSPVRRLAPKQEEGGAATLGE